MSPARLLDQAAKAPDAVNADGWTALHVAARHNRDQAIPRLVTPTNLNHWGHGAEPATPLMVAAAAGATKAVRALLAAGADIRCCTSSGRTALGDALAGGHCTAALLIWKQAQRAPDCEQILAAAVAAAGPALNLPLDASGSICSANITGATPLARAVKGGYHQLVPLLVTPHNLNRLLTEKQDQLTPLHLAIVNNNAWAAEALLDAGAAVNIPDSNGLIPLAYSVQRKMPQLSVRMLQLLKQQQQQPAAAGDAAPMEPVITAAAWLCSTDKQAHSCAQLFAAVASAWGPGAAADLLQGLLKHLGDTPHHLAETLLRAWREAQRDQLATYRLLDWLQRLVLEPVASSSRKQQQQQQPVPAQDQAFRLRLPQPLLLNQPLQFQELVAQGSQNRATAAASSLAAGMGGLSLGPSSSSSSQGDVIAAAAQRGALREVAALLAAVPDQQQPAALLVAAQAAGQAGHTYLCNAALQQFATLDWQMGLCTKAVAPFGALVRAAVAAAPGPANGTGAGRCWQDTPATHGSMQQLQGGAGASPGFCLYQALLDSWAAVEHMVGLELAATVVEAVEAGTAQADGEA